MTVALETTSSTIDELIEKIRAYDPDADVEAVRREIGEHVLAKMGAFLLKPSLRRFRDRVDYSNHGGAPLLGVNGVSIIGHGRSTPKAVMNALRVTADLVSSGVIDEIRAELGRVEGGRVASS